MKLVFIYQIGSFLSDLIFSILTGLKSSKAHISWDFFTIFAICLFAYLFYRILSNKIFKTIVLVISSLLCIYSIYYLVFNLVNPTNKGFDSLMVAFEGISVIIYSILYFFEQLTKPTKSNQLFIYNTPTFWIVIAFLLFFSGTFFLLIYIYFQKINIDTDIYFKTQYAIIISIFTLIENILLGIAMFSNNKMEVNTSSRQQTY